MIVIFTHDASGACYLDPEIVYGEAPISVTIAPPSGASWTITGVSSDPSASWSGSTASLPEGGYDISVTCSDTGKSGTGSLRVSGGVKED